MIKNIKLISHIWLMKLLSSILLIFLDFPTLVIHGDLLPDGRLSFNKGKSTTFHMHSEDLKPALENKPFYVMFIDG